MLRLAIGLFSFGILPLLGLNAQSSLSVGTAPSSPGNTINLPISARRITNFTALQFDIDFDPAKAAPRVLNQATALSSHRLASREIAPGVRRVLFYSTANKSLTFTTSQVFANLTVTVAKAVDDSTGPLTPVNAMAARPDGSAVTQLTLIPGAAFVRPVVFLPSGIAQFLLPSQPDVKYLIQATTDFVTWSNILTNTSTGAYMDLRDSNAAQYPYRFYRWVLFDAFGQIGEAQILPGPQLVFRISGSAGRTYIVQASLNLTDWRDITTLTNLGGGAQFTNVIAPTFPARFYRLQSPAP